jgi:hypothetical protein
MVNDKMNIKNLISLLFSMLILISMANAADVYEAFELTFDQNIPADVLMQTFVCADASCTDASPVNLQHYAGDAITCWDTFYPTGDSVGFEACMLDYEISNLVPTNDCSIITDGCSGNPIVITRYDSEVSFGYVNYFFTRGDVYIPKVSWQTGFSCETDICFNDVPYLINSRKIDTAIAEIGQLNIVNIVDPLKPVQVNVPVSIDETVCSAYRSTNPNLFRPTAPGGFSDFSANTLVTLEIRNNVDNSLIRTEAVTIPMLVDTCGGLAAFSWTPSALMQGDEIKFRVETDVIDNQVINSITDFAEVIEYIFPENLDGSCWMRAYDFTLSNIPSIDMTTSVAQISQGESLYATFRGGAFRDETVNPIDFQARLLFDNTLVFSTYESTSPATTEADLETFTFDLTNTISSLGPGQYNVTLDTEPFANGCTIREGVIQTQNLQILQPDTHEVTFIIKDQNNQLLSGAEINFRLLDSDDYYVNTPVYNEFEITGTTGRAIFTDVYTGQHQYLVTGNGFTSVSNQVYVGGDSVITVIVPLENIAPFIDLPTQLTADYKETITIDLRDFVTDFNDAFENLAISEDLVSGNIVRNINGPIMTFSTNTPNSGVVEVFVQDPSGAIASDSITINFVNDEAPVINTFTAEPTSGEEPFNTRFIVDVSDDGTSLLCTIDFGDGQSNQNSCNNLDSIEHTYILPGTYVAQLSADDGVNEPIIAEEMIFVFNRTIEAPLINYFRLDTSNGPIVPTDLTFSWDVSHSGNLSMTCELYINADHSVVPCIGSAQELDFNLTGVSRFSIVAIDTDSTQVLRTIERKFYTDAVRLDEQHIDLIIDDVIVPGEFKFQIETLNETLQRRVIDVKPTIICNGVRNFIDNGNRMLSSSAISKETIDSKTFEFVTDSKDFKLVVPTDVECTVEVELTDDFGSLLTLSDRVTFSYPVVEANIASIRGKGTDIVNYMTSTVNVPFSNGYNSIEFVVENNEVEGKEITITMISADLGLTYSEELNLAPGASRKVQIPLYIADNIDAGRYPIRYSVIDGTDKQVRYGFVMIE